MLDRVIEVMSEASHEYAMKMGSMSGESKWKIIALALSKAGLLRTETMFEVVDEREDPETDYYDYWLYGITSNGTRVILRGDETRGDAHFGADQEASKPKNRKRFKRYVIEERL